MAAADHAPVKQDIVLNDAAGTYREIKIQTDGTDRWQIRCNSTAEGGSEAGSDLEVVARQDDGTINYTSIFIERKTGKVGINASLATLGEELTVNGSITLLEKSADPSSPAEGTAVIWLSDGSGLGDDGDVMIASNAGGTVKYGTLFDNSAGTSWPA